jgi:hypothetical protein
MIDMESDEKRFREWSDDLVLIGRRDWYNKLSTSERNFFDSLSNKLKYEHIGCKVYGLPAKTYIYRLSISMFNKQFKNG